MNEGPDDRALLEAARNDARALQKLFFRAYDRLSAVVSRRLPMWIEKHHSVEDVLHDTFARVMRGIATFESREPEVFYAWCTRIAENHISNLVEHFQAQKRRGGGPEVSLDFVTSQAAASLLSRWSRSRHTPSEVAANNEKIEQLNKCMEELAPDALRVLQLRFGQGRSVRSTAQVMGRTERAVEQLTFRSLRELRQRFPRSRP